MDSIRVYNTLTRRVEPLKPRQPGRVGMYVCGMTVYDYCHIGHARAMITFDVIYRYLQHRGYEVTFVRNHTDVDDKIIRRAQENGEDPLALSRRFIAALEQDMEALGLREPTHEPRVSEHIPEIVRLIERILENGHGYVVGGDVFFSVESFRAYGQLSGREVSDMRAGERVAVDERKRHPADFALWKAGQPGEPTWDSPWGPGRPGWHIECSAMSQAYLGESFDIHGGGADLVFPHHENEIAQAEAGTGQAPFVRYWLHNGMLTLAEEKMSKSLGNIVPIRELVRKIPGEALRLLYLEHHYRSPVPYSNDRLNEALVALDRLYRAREIAVAAADRVRGRSDLPSAEAVAADYGEPGQNLLDRVERFEDRFHEAMDDDFNSSRAIGHLFDLVRAANRFAGLPRARRRGAILLARVLDVLDLAGDILGIGTMPPEDWFEEMREKRLRAMGLERSYVERRLQERDEARKARNYGLADEIRDELSGRGIVIMDTPGGVTWRVRA